ncbi:MAG TPA: FKBP-type peptidyl-prolyl cis-trans isomerase [Anditalea sp.]|nr:FKBP-type peptidyl-prolyl cis-trans isomerase [Anditalea sp.]
MNLITRSVTALVLALGMNACLPEVESEMDKIVERDDQLLQAYIAQNNITAQRTQMGFYYTKELEVDGATQITNNNIVGIYYTIKSIDGQVIESYGPENGAPRPFLHGESGMIPRVINFAAGLAREGEVIKLYAPSYLAYGNYGYQQLILPNSNLDMTVTFAKIYSLDEMKELEDQRIQEYIAANDLEGFTKTDEGAYMRILESGEAESEVTKDGSNIRFNFELMHINETEPFLRQAQESGAVNIIVGSQNNLKFLNIAFVGLKKETKVELLVPSHLAYGSTVQVIPEEIRKDLIAKELIVDRAKPYHPLQFIARVKAIS